MPIAPFLSSQARLPISHFPSHLFGQLEVSASLGPFLFSKRLLASRLAQVDLSVQPQVTDRVGGLEGVGLKGEKGQAFPCLASTK